MNPLKIIDAVARTVLVIGIFLLFMNANRSPKIKYTPYEILVWELKANEGYRSTWYRDGFVNGKKAYSIGFGWNDQGQRRRHEIREFTRDGKVTFEEATQITLLELKKYGTLHNDPYRDLALKLYSYNCGLTKEGRKLGKCHGGSRGCGHRDADVRAAHNRRRKFELALWKHDFPTVLAYTETNRDKLHNYIAQLKQRGQY